MFADCHPIDSDDPAAPSSPQWQEFLERRGVAPAGMKVERLNGVTNDTWKLTPRRRTDSFVVRHYRRTEQRDEVQFELAAVRFLAGQGFPVADVVDARDGARSDHIHGRPAAMFRYVSGTVGESPGEAGCSDLTGGRQAASLLAQMHLTTRGQTFPGSRSERGTPIQRLEHWLTQDGADPELLDIPGGELFLSQLNRHLDLLRTSLGRQPKLWQGLVHGDVAPNNIVRNDAGEVAALIDFDDCTNSFVAYDLASILWYWGRSESGDLDDPRIQTLIQAYDQTRNLTDDEQELLIPLLATFLAADAIGKISWWWRGARRPRPIADIHTARVFLDLTMRSE